MRPFVNAIIAVMILLTGGMLVLALIQKVRLAAMQSVCSSNLRHIGIATNNFEIENSHFPRAAKANSGLPAEARLSWFIELSAYVEATNQYVRMDGDAGWEAENNLYLALVDMPKVYQCPNADNRGAPSMLLPSPYIGIAGLGVDAADLEPGDLRAGFFGYERSISRTDIEGRANTLAIVCDTLKLEGAWTAAGPPTVRGLDTTASPYLGPGGQFGGAHSGVALVLFVDASVRGLPVSTDAAVIEAMVKLTDGSAGNGFGER